ncbi:S8 family serine peptidase [Promicromonospora sukumoe]|uniref:Subtilisin family serine protease n=1 Tax=Promicromonospora sukumoe TaxID=88382 RepID=A0A7W3J7F8_9MICO|nr:S8 family peptidase [Promicromonospora sukumoe]MBA8807707.1 subtilisin family serine protease [Promicromonospora sukumoe]
MIAGLVGAIVGVTTTEMAAASNDPSDTTPATLGSAATSVTLLTGDTVRVTALDGRRSATIEPAEGREAVTVHQLEIDGELHVLPQDALPYVADDALDLELFSIDALIDQGYDDASTDTLPVIATYGEGMRAQDVEAFAGAEPENLLESIDGQALAVDKSRAGGFWASITSGDVGAASAGGAADLAGGVEKLWLDGKVEVDLHESTAQIGAPAAWEAGLDGTGATVAVLDTGIDATHPDLVGKVVAQENFTPESSPYDGHGHGTHVAATVAGTGAGSGGLRAGVAPGADLIVGKVLDDSGSGSESEVIAGMQWAAESGADVVNMSLGGDPTDGTDPMSLAVDELSAAHDTLFVVAAGNSGPGASTVGSPGAATTALTVGAVDRDESLAEFSSRGPRVGDLAVKPEITAPGVGIVAARSGGTSMGTPVDALYTGASGTSMASPHVAGAAAILAAQHPGWSSSALKDALVSTAAPADLGVYEQGGGRVDVARVTTQEVVATGSLSLGAFDDGDTDTVTRDVSWTNSGDTDVELDLELALTNARGDSPGDAITVDGDTVTVPAGETVTAPLTVDVAALPVGQFTGWLTARAGDVVARTTVAVTKDPPVHTVTLRGLGRDGKDAQASPVALFGADPRFDVVTFDSATETRTIELAEGTYFLHAAIDGADERDTSVVVDPDLEVTGDMELVLDARTANHVEIETPKPSVARGTLGFTTYRQLGSRSFTNSTMKFDGTSDIYVTPTDRAEGGEFEFTSRWQLSAPMLRAEEPGLRGLSLTPRYEQHSPEADVRGFVPVVDVGQGRPEDYAGRRDVRGAIAVAHLEDKGATDDAVAAAVRAGAVLLLIAPPADDLWWVSFTGQGPRMALPTAVLSAQEAQQVADRLERGFPKLRLRLDGDQQVPYRYDVVQVSADRVPERVRHTVSSRNTTTVTANYHSMGGEDWAKEQRFAWRPWQSTTIVERQHELREAQSRTEYVSSGDPDTLWRQHVLHYSSWDSFNPLIGGSVHDTRTYRPGERITYDWFGGVQRPVVGGAQRTGDSLRLDAAEFVQGPGETYQRAAVPEESTSRVLEDGVVIGEGAGLSGTYPATKRSATYRVELSTRRDDPEWTFGTATDSVWTFRSERPRSGATSSLPLMRVDYDVPVGLDNLVSTKGSTHDVRLTVAHPGVQRAPRVTSVEAWASFDDGRTWDKVRVDRHRDGFDAEVRHRGQDGPVSLKVRATDSDGSTVTQSVVRAYGLD